jgi:uncharacterized tellurite resistance protein B-like protein
MNMAAHNLELLDQFKDTHEEAQPGHKATFRLTPHLVLAAALLHMMASDGEIDDAESSQLQSVIGGDQHVMNVAVQYVQAVPLAQFLTEAYQVLDKASTLCILTNVCDSLLADGSAGADEVALFERMKTAWGIDTATFAPFERAIALKNNDTVMGEYKADQLDQTAGSAHLALAASLLYMMAADGTIATEEIGQLQTVIGEFKGLQEAALKQVRSVKLPEFLKRVTPSLSPDVKLYILTNVCDLMMADGDVDALESKIFQNMLTGYGHDSASFKPFYQSIKVKNIKTFSASVLKPKLIFSNVASGKDQDEKGVRFNRDQSFQEDAAQTGNKLGTVSGKGTVISNVLPGQEGAYVGNRTMQDNIDKVSQVFGDEDRIHQVQENALADQNILKAKSSGIADNVQTVDGKTRTPGVPGPVLQAAATHGAGPILLNVDAAQATKPLLNKAQDSANVIGLPGHALSDNVASLPNQGIADRNLPLPTTTDGANQAKLAATGVGDNAIKLASAGVLDNAIQLVPAGAGDNAIKLAASANEDHLEKLPSAQGVVNIQAVPDSAQTTHRLALPNKPVGTNQQAAPSPAAVTNRQAAAQDPLSSNRADAPIQTIGTHRAKLPDTSVTRASLSIAKSPAAPAGPNLTAARAVVQKANRLKQLSEHVSQLRLRLDQLAGLNNEVLAAAQQAAGGACNHCGNPKCLFTHHVKTNTG